MTVRRIPCTACAKSPTKDRKFCHECKGVGFIEYFEKPPGCTGSQPKCPIEYDPGVGGWECSKCGLSGPL